MSRYRIIRKLTPGSEGLFLDHFQTLGERQIGRNAPEPGESFARDDGETFYQQDSSAEVQSHVGNFPVATAHVLLVKHDTAATVEVSENSPAEADGLEERAVNAGKPVMDGIHQHVALHSGQDLFDA